MTDTENEGALNEAGFFRLLKYVSIVQVGLPLEPASLAQGEQQCAGGETMRRRGHPQRRTMTVRR
jgi:hypothetical protein